MFIQSRLSYNISRARDLYLITNNDISGTTHKRACAQQGIIMVTFVSKHLAIMYTDVLSETRCSLMKVPIVLHWGKRC